MTARSGSLSSCLAVRINWLSTIHSLASLPERREALESEKIAFGLADGRFGGRIQDPPRKAIELARDLRVAGERERHARVERRGHRLVVARERVVNRMPERALDLLRRNR